VSAVVKVEGADLRVQWLAKAHDTVEGEALPRTLWCFLRFHLRFVQSRSRSAQRCACLSKMATARPVAPPG